MTTPLQRVPHDDLESFERLREIIRAAEQVDGTPPISDQAMLAAKQGERALFGIASDSEKVETGPQFAGVGIIGEGEVDLVIHPAARGRGLGTAALNEMISIQDHATPRSDDSLAAPTNMSTVRPPAAFELRAWAHGENPAATALLARAGFAPIRSLYRLALDPAKLDTAIETSRTMPDGFRLAAFDTTDRAQAEAWVRVNAAAFASHPEQGGVTLEDFENLEREPWFAPEDLILAFDTTQQETAEGDRLAGYAWVKTTHDGDSTHTELYVLGVDPEYAGRGLGAALLGATLRRMAEHSPDHITLYVDGDNENARALYDRVGFDTDQLSRQWLLGERERERTLIGQDLPRESE